MKTGLHFTTHKLCAIKLTRGINIVTEYTEAHIVVKSLSAHRKPFSAVYAKPTLGRLVKFKLINKSHLVKIF